MPVLDRIDISQYLNQGILVLDAHGCILGWNKWLTKHTHFLAAEVEGKLLSDVFPELKKRAGFSRLLSAFSSQSVVVLSPAIHQYLLPIKTSSAQMTKGIEYMLQLVNGQIITLPDGSPALLVCITDVTENYLLNKKIQANFQEIQEKNKQLDIARQHTSLFLANMSHELRTPLNSILVLSQILGEHQNMDDKERELAHIIHSSGKGLLKLINDVLDLAKVEAGRLDVVCEPFPLDDLIKSQKAIFEPLVADKNFAFTVEADSNIPLFFNSDIHRISQILSNFLSNAFKFTHEGYVNLHIGCQHNYKGYVNALVFSVCDTGIGIEQNNIDEIFKAFRQADGTISRNYGGTGLGLSISKELAELLGGQVCVESVVGQGSCFRLILPILDDQQGGQHLQHVSKQDNAGESIEQHGVHGLYSGAFDEKLGLELLRNKRILIVSNIVRNIYVFTALFEKRGMTVISICQNGNKPELTELYDVDLILFESATLTIDTIHAIESIRSCVERSDVPLFIIGFKDATIESGRSTLIQEVLPAPLQLDVFSQLLVRYLS
jgi:two-component system chemotaxis sensor kinase CheA